jgi:hypothetical protein
MGNARQPELLTTPAGEASELPLEWPLWGQDFVSPYVVVPVTCMETQMGSQQRTGRSVVQAVCAHEQLSTPAGRRLNSPCGDASERSSPEAVEMAE